MKWFDVNPCYVFHTLNSYEDGDDIVVNGCRLREIWRNSSDIAVSSDPNPEDAPMMWEWRLNMETGAVSERQIDDRGSEFPQILTVSLGLNTDMAIASPQEMEESPVKMKAAQQSNTISLMAALLKTQLSCRSLSRRTFVRSS